MNKYIQWVFAFLLFSQNVDAQPLLDQYRDYIWHVGAVQNVQEVNFNVSPPNVSPLPIPFMFSSTYASICDTSGNLLFYTNGRRIADMTDDVMMNGDSIGFGPAWTQVEFSYPPDGFNWPQNALILPSPGHPNEYYLFYTLFYQQADHFSRGFIYSKIDMAGNNALGRVTEKNITHFNDTIAVGKVTAVRHANGRDWWIVFMGYQINKYHCFLLSPDGLGPVSTTMIGPLPTILPGPQPYYYDQVFQIAFSPNGEKLAVYHVTYGTMLINFDRCEGTFGAYDFIPLDSALWASVGGPAFSPSSRYLYLSMFQYIIQYDTWANDLAASADTVATYYVQPGAQFGQLFYLAHLAPDEKIYIVALNGDTTFHRINNPDEAGVACNALQHSFPIHAYNANTIPNFPNFRLGAEIGTVCDSLGIGNPFYTGVGLDPPHSAQEVNVLAYPNPANDHLTIGYSPLGEGASYKLYDLTGRLMMSGALPPDRGKIWLNVSGLAVGMYVLQVEAGGRMVEGVKVFVAR